MNYITEIKGFYDLVEMKCLSTGQIALWHALMYVNNKCFWEEWFTVPNLTLELLTGLSRQSISKNRNALKQAGLIDFKSNGTKATSYTLKSLQVGLQDSLQNSIQDSLQVGLQSSVQGSLQNGSTLININETKHKKENINKKEKAAEDVRHKRGEYKHVLLSDREISRLEKDYGTELAQESIRFLDEYVEMKGYKCKNYNLTIRKWVIDAVKERWARNGRFRANNEPDSNRDFTEPNELDAVSAFGQM